MATKLTHADPSACCTVDGVPYGPGDDGLVEVPDEVVGILTASFGFIVAPPPAPAKKKAAPKE